MGALTVIIVRFLAPVDAYAGRTEPVASYAIDVRLDTEAKTLTGREVVTYTNRTDEPIPDLVFHLYLNAFSSTETNPSELASIPSASPYSG